MRSAEMSGAVRRRLVLALALCALAPGMALGKPDYVADFLLAVQRDDVPTVEALTHDKVSPNIHEPLRGETGLMLAIRENAMRVFEVLLKLPDIDVEAKANNGDNAMMIAAWLGNLDAVSKLIDAGAEVNRPGWTALHYACANNHREIVELLLENSAYIDAEAPNRTTPLMMAARSGHGKLAQYLIRQGADYTLKNEHGMDAEDFARASDFPDVIVMMQRAIKGIQKASPVNPAH